MDFSSGSAISTIDPSGDDAILQLELWSPTKDIATFGTLLGQEVWTPDPTSSQAGTVSMAIFQELAAQVQSLKEQVYQLSSEHKGEQKRCKANRMRHKRQAKNVRRDVDQLEDSVNLVKSWGCCVNEVVQPMVEERLERETLAVEEKKHINDFCDMVDDGYLQQDDSDFSE